MAFVCKEEGEPKYANRNTNAFATKLLCIQINLE